MLSELDPIRTTEHIRTSYLRYLKTIYPLENPALSKQFWGKLEETDRLVKGPLLEGAPPFMPARSIMQLMKDGVLHRDFRVLASDALPLERPLYAHQDKAVVKSVQLGRNLVVATGTGSGKTEAFLLPIFDHLLRERERGTLAQPGVRALLLYPMNALANDQMKRLRRLLAVFPEITFGRYIGESENEAQKAKEQFRKQFSEEPIENELLSREDMRARPPHILLTNYAMLEYLLLRPADSEFFDGRHAGRWRFIVLDEAHTYDGATGIEIAMLLRRLKDRIIKSERGRLQCIATSATLGSKDDLKGIVEFASNLFGEDFEWDDSDPNRQDVISAERVPLSALGETWGVGAPELYSALWQTLRASEEDSQIQTRLREQARACGVPAHVVDASDRSVEQFLFDILRGDQRVQRLREMLAETPCFFTAAAANIFPAQPDSFARLAELVSLAVRARPDANSLALMPARYHLFARALEGAFVCLRDHADWSRASKVGLLNPRVYLTRHQICPECKERERKAQAFELAACTRCGREYLVGRIVPVGSGGLFDDTSGLTHLKQLVADFGDIRGEKAYFLLGEQFNAPDEDEETAFGEEVATEPQGEPYTLCVACGAIAPHAEGELRCLCVDRPSTHMRVIRVDLKGHEELRHCASCGSRSTSEIVYRFLPGQDAPVSVLATALYQQIPPARAAIDKPGQGRKLLIFSDSRQDAAFFAAYMDRTYGNLLRRRLIVRTLQEEQDTHAGLYRLKDLVTPILTRAEEANLFTQDESYIGKQNIVWTWLMQEFLALDRRISPEGVGLMAFRLVKPNGWQPLAPLNQAPWHLNADEQWTLLQILLDTLRQQGVVTFPNNVSPKDDAFAPRARELFMRAKDANARAGILSWSPVRGSNRRLDFLLRLLNVRASHLAEDERRNVAMETLNALWQSHLTTPQSLWREHLPSLSRGADGVVYRLGHAFWEVVPTLMTEVQAKEWRRCAQCGLLTRLDLGICSTYRCNGALVAFNPQEVLAQENHYRNLYLNLKSIAFGIEEHTAQWKSDEAASIQEKFIQGDVNALSCSTTFELGVDVGDLQAVLMRNVPPTTANYVQRAGRAGRRTDSTAFALTFAQRRSHDLTQYANPVRIVAGKIHPPSFAIANEKIIRRHMHSVAFAMFFRLMRDQRDKEFRNVGAFFESNDGTSAGPELLQQFLTSYPKELQNALARIVPVELQAELAIDTWGWINPLCGPENEGLLDHARNEVKTDLETFSKLMDEASEQKRGYDIERYKRILVTLRGRDLLGFLGARNVLPKYGFPVDVVELKTDHLHIDAAKKLDLQRDLRIALSEYAPGSEIVAGKRVWTSGGLYRRADRGWPEYYYAVCANCGRFNRSVESSAGVCTTCQSPLSEAHAGARGQFIIPIFGFVADPKEPRAPGEARPQRIYTSRVFFADYAGGEPEISIEGDLALGSKLVVGKRYSRQGQLALINSGPQGRGFRICMSCGYGELTPKSTKATRNTNRQHDNPRTSRKCQGTMAHRHLGHEFQTDVLELQLNGTLCSGRDQSFWLSLLYALMEGASEALNIQRDDLDGCLYPYGVSQPPALILFDNVPGGAGHVRRVGANLKSVFAAALERVANCECGPETSCYECLRNYWNQPYHEVLARGPVTEFLRSVLGFK